MISAVFAATLVNAVSLSSTLTLSDTALVIAPQYCVVAEKGQACETAMHIRWQLPQAMPVCLRENERTLQCWQDQRQGQWQYKAKVQLPAIYSLTHAQTGELVVDTQLELQTMQSSRRRLRSVWSFF